MAIVVSDTSAIRALHHLSLLSLIAALYGELIVPPAVDDELRSPLPHFKAIDVARMGIGKIVTPSPPFLNKVTPFQLDPGESEALSVALELKADYLLIDERRGRMAAQSLGIQHIGVLGVLIEAKRRGLINEVAPLIKRLRLELRFHISPRFEEQVLRSIGEKPEAS